MNEWFNRLGEMGIIPVVVIEKAAGAPALGQALLAGGLPCAEITFRTAAAAQAVEAIATKCPDVLVGAGTILTVEQAKTAVAAGAQFVVTPGFDANVVDYCLTNHVPIIPGVMTPTEINMVLSKGLRLMKFFPAEAAGGVKALKAIGGPYGGVKFVPTGGINPANLADYLSLPMVHACGGSWMVNKSLLVAGNFAEITHLAQEAVTVVAQVRRGGG